MDLDRLRDPEVASEEANQEDVAGGLGREKDRCCVEEAQEPVCCQLKITVT